MLRFGTEEIRYFEIYFAVQLLINFIMCIMKHSRKVTQLKKQVTKDATKQNELDEAVAEVDRGFIHKNALAEFTFFFTLRSALSNVLMRAGYQVMLKFNARPPMFTAYPVQLEELFQMVDQFAAQWNLNKKYFQRPVYEKVANKMLVAFCKVPINKVASVIPALVFPPYKKFPGLVSAVK